MELDFRDQRWLKWLRIVFNISICYYRFEFTNTELVYRIHYVLLPTTSEDGRKLVL